jgi:hypothetical protein
VAGSRARLRPRSAAAISVGKRCFRNQIVSNFVKGKIEVAEPNNIVEHNTILEP